MTKTFLTTLSLLTLLSTATYAQTTGTTGTTGSTPPAPAASTGTKAADVSADYRLNNGDKLRVEVYRDEQLSQTLQIRPDGKITLPLVGDVVAAGKTSTELRDTLTERLGEFLRNPDASEVTVIVVETVPMHVYVMGEVKSAGPQPVKGETSILQVLAMAGGFTEWAKRKDVMILRPDQTTVRFNYNDAVNGRSKMLTVRPGDTIIVP